MSATMPTTCWETQPLAKSLMAAADKDQVLRVLEAIRGALAAHERPDGVYLASAAWLVAARRP